MIVCWRVTGVRERVFLLFRSQWIMSTPRLIIRYRTGVRVIASGLVGKSWMQVTMRSVLPVRPNFYNSSIESSRHHIEGQHEVEDFTGEELIVEDT